MADITMCKGCKTKYVDNKVVLIEGEDVCPLKDKCYRHTAPANEHRQSYFVSPPYDKEKEKCEEYWPPFKQEEE